MALRDTVSRYDAATFTLNTGTTDVNVATTVAALFANVPEAQFVEIRTTQNITAKINATGNDSITINSTDSPRTFTNDKEHLAITNFFLSNASGTNSTVTIFLT